METRNRAKVFAIIVKKNLLEIMTQACQPLTHFKCVPSWDPRENIFKRELGLVLQKLFVCMSGLQLATQHMAVSRNLHRRMRITFNSSLSRAPSY